MCCVTVHEGHLTQRRETHDTSRAEARGAHRYRQLANSLRRKNPAVVEVSTRVRDRGSGTPPEALSVFPLHK